MSTKKKTTFKVLAEALVFNKLDKLNISMEHLDKRKLTIDEIKDLIKEAFGKAKEVSDVKVKEPERGWGDADLEKEINWTEKLQLKEFFDLDEEKEGEEEKKEEESEEELDD